MSDVRPASVAAVHAGLLGVPSGADLAREARRLAAAVEPLASAARLDVLASLALAEAQGLGPLEDLLADRSVTEIMVNGGRHVWVERSGQLERVPLELAPGVAARLVERIVAPLGLRADRSSPVVDARLPDGSRVAAVLPPLSPDGVSLCIRRFGASTLPLAAFGPPVVVDLLLALVAEGANLLVSGATSAGKTSLLGALCAHLPAHERVVTIEDAAELRLPGEHVVRLEARPATADGLGRVEVRDLVRSALRLRPDRIIVGEVRGAEAIDMLQALSTGHDGSLSTVHATSALDALRRVEALVLSASGALPLAVVRELVHAAVDVVVHVVRGSDGRRQVAEVAELVPPGELRPRGPRVCDVLAEGRRRPPRRPQP